MGYLQPRLQRGPLVLLKFGKKQQKFNLNLLKSENTKREFSLELKNRFDALTDLDMNSEDVKSHWEKLKVSYIKDSLPCGMLVSSFRAISYSNIVNGLKLLYDAHHMLLEQHIWKLQLYLFYSLSSFSSFSFYMFVTLTVLFLGASLVCVNKSREDSRFSL